jgi:hypothetical protein
MKARARARAGHGAADGSAARRRCDRCLTDLAHTVQKVLAGVSSRGYGGLVRLAHQVFRVQRHVKPVTIRTSAAPL